MLEKLSDPETRLFKPEYLGRINMHMSAVDDLLAHADDQPTIELLLCKTKNNVVADYSLNGFSKPIGASRNWKPSFPTTYQTSGRPREPAPVRRDLPSPR